MDLHQALEWYVKLAKQPGFKAYVWHRVNEMAQEWPSVYGALPDMLKEAMRDERTQKQD